MNLLQFRASVYCMCVACFLVLLSGCATTATTPVEIAQESPLNFVDLDRFDQELERNIKDKTTPITIEFYGQVSINSLPERVQNWLSLVDSHGQGVEVIANSENVRKGSLGFVLSMLPQARAFFLHNRRIELIQPYSASVELLPESDIIRQLVLQLPSDPVVR